VDEEYDEVWRARDEGVAGLETYARGLIFDIEQAANRLLELSFVVRDLPNDAIERSPGELVRPAVTDPEALQAAADKLLAASKVALAHAGAWRVHLDDTRTRVDELRGWEETPSWATGSSSDS
jgi:hypothetical protein